MMHTYGEAMMDLVIDKLISSSNGKWDTEAFRESAYGQAMAERIALWYRFEPDYGCEACTAFYRSLGVTRELHDDGGYYDRWVILYPKELLGGNKYPLVVFNHGVTGSIEHAEFCAGYGLICGKEQFFALYMQNTNTDNVKKILDHVFLNYPVDPERIYISGHSQGGRQTSSFVVEYPEIVTAFALSGNDVFRNGSVSGRIYTDEEYAHLKEVFLPCMQIAGEVEYGNILPLNQWQDPPANRWTPAKDLPKNLGPMRDPRRDAEPDPTVPEGVVRFNPKPPAQASQEEKDRWKIDMLNKRLDTLHIVPRDVEKCLSYRDCADSELHRFLGFYGDYERIEYHGGLRFYMSDIYNVEGLDAFRYVGIENTPHHTSAAHGALTWDFFRQFRRDSASGKVVFDPYRPESDRISARDPLTNLPSLV